jgi:cell division septation protein DedD
MRKQNLRNWELRLGLSHIVILLGVATGCIACAFYLGFFSGRSAGFERMLAGDSQHLARLPIDQKVNMADAEKELVSEVYAKLGDVGQQGGVDEKGRERQETQDRDRKARPFVIPEELAPESEEQAQADEGEKVSEKDGKDSEGKNKRIAVRVLGEGGLAEPVLQPASSSLDGGHTTLGALRDGEGSKRVAEKKLPSGAEKGAGRMEVAVGGISKPGRAAAESPASLKPSQVKAPLVLKGRFGAEEGNNKEPGGANDSSGFLKELVPSGWFAQLAAPHRLEDADNLAQRLRGSGVPVIIERANIRGQEYFRVLVGPEQNKEQADRLVEQLRRESYVKAEPFIMRVR